MRNNQLAASAKSALVTETLLEGKKLEQNDT
jgi:hypothetical protein